MVVYVLYRDNEGLKLCDARVKYIRDGETIEQYVGEEGKEWWLEFARKWSIEIVEFLDVVYSEEQLARFEEVKGLDVNEVALQRYVEDRIIGDGLEILKLQKENKELRQLLADLTETVLLGGI